MTDVSERTHHASGEFDLAADDQLQLSISGMTCAACARRVERKLSELPGVQASVNFATERALVIGLSPETAAVAVDAVKSAGYDAAVHDPDAGADEWSRRASIARISSLRRRLFVAALLTVPLGDITIVLALVPGLRFPGWETLCVLLALPIVTWAAWPFHRAAWRGLRHRTTSMDTLISLGVIVSFGWAVITLLLGDDGEPGYWLGFGITPSGANSLYLDVAAGVTTFQLAGRYFEARARRRAGEVLGALTALTSARVRVMRDGAEIEVAPARVCIGETVVVRAGESVGVDGTVLEGRAEVDTSAMTGESQPRPVAPGSPVSAGYVNTDGHLLIAAEVVGVNTRLAQVAALAERAQSRKAGVERLVDRVVAWFVPVVLVLSAAVLAGWLIAGAGPREAFGNAVAVMIIACPCALGLATPTALLVGMGRASQRGILIKGMDALEASGRIDTVVLDKTGTVTSGDLEVLDIACPDDRFSSEALLAYAASVEAASEHPIGRAIVAAAHRDSLILERAAGIEVLPGVGIRGLVDGHVVQVGRARGVSEQRRAAPTGSTQVSVSIDGTERGQITLADQLDPTAPAAVSQLRAMGLRVVLMTGDSADAARSVGETLQVDETIAGVMPADKAAKVAAMRAAGQAVAMVGDGINDAAALAESTLGIALSRGTEVAMRSADVIVIRPDLSAVPEAVRLSRKTLSTIRINLLWACGYNVVAIPIAAAGLLNPLIAAGTMALSSLLVVTNSLRLQDA